jgi:tau tubulin kinase
LKVPSIYVLNSDCRPWLEAPLLQQAAFDELVYEVDVMRNVATRLTQTEKEEAEHQKERERRPSLPVSYSV